jgi:hypothetical protein
VSSYRAGRAVCNSDHVVNQESDGIRRRSGNREFDQQNGAQPHRCEVLENDRRRATASVPTRGVSRVVVRVVALTFARYLRRRLRASDKDHRMPVIACERLNARFGFLGSDQRSGTSPYRWHHGEAWIHLCGPKKGRRSSADTHGITDTEKCRAHPKSSSAALGFIDSRLGRRVPRPNGGVAKLRVRTG